MDMKYQLFYLFIFMKETKSNLKEHVNTHLNSLGSLPTVFHFNIC